MLTHGKARISSIFSSLREIYVPAYGVDSVSDYNSSCNFVGDSLSVAEVTVFRNLRSFPAFDIKRDLVVLSLFFRVGRWLYSCVLELYASGFRPCP